MTHDTLILCLLLAATIPVHSQNQPSADFSIPEPTDLSVVALRADTTLLWSQEVGHVQSTGANATITAIEMASRDGQRLRGITVSLSSSDATDKLYLGEFELLRFRDELTELGSELEGFSTRCEAILYCVTGVGRCRPSQNVPQAYCPGVYTTSSSQEGFGLSTPRHSFQFPAIKPSNFTVAIDAAAKALDERSQLLDNDGNEDP